MKRQLGGHPVDETLTPVEDIERFASSRSGAQIAPEQPQPGSMPGPSRKSRKRSSPARWFLLSLGLFVGGALVVQSVDFVEAMFMRDTALGIIFSILLGMTVASAIYWALVEIRRIRRLRIVEPLREEGLRLTESEAYEGALPWIDRAAAALGENGDRKALVEKARDRILDTHTDASAMLIFHDTVLLPLDEQAYAAIARAARGAALGVSVSPLALLDAALILWRSVRMVREIAEIYGLRPGFAGSFILMRHLLMSGIYAVSVDILGNVWVEHLGGKVTSLVSTRLAEGIVAAVRVARLGLLAMEGCRPMSFTERDRPGLLKLREQIMKWEF
jgi:putative membrane protein